jgi:hypothetical protein
VGDKPNKSQEKSGINKGIVFVFIGVLIGLFWLIKKIFLDKKG